MSGSDRLLRHLSDSEAINVLAFVGGFTDAAGFIKLRALFTSSITGNVVIACTAVSGSLVGVISRAAVTIAFVIAGFISSLLALKLKLYYKRHLRETSMILFSIEVAFLAIAVALGVSWDNRIDRAHDVDDINIIIVGCAMAYAMGAHSVAAKESIANAAPTTVMTNTLINVSAAGASVVGYALTKHAGKQFTLSRTDPLNPLTPEAEEQRTAAVSKSLGDSRAKVYILGQPLLWFVVGALVGALVMHKIQFWSMIIPLFAVVGIMVDIAWQHYGAPAVVSAPKAHEEGPKSSV